MLYRLCFLFKNGQGKTNGRNKVEKQDTKKRGREGERKGRRGKAGRERKGGIEKGTKKERDTYLMITVYEVSD